MANLPQFQKDNYIFTSTHTISCWPRYDFRRGVLELAMLYQSLEGNHRHSTIIPFILGAKAWQDLTMTSLSKTGLSREAAPWFLRYSNKPWPHSSSLCYPFEYRLAKNTCQQPNTAFDGAKSRQGTVIRDTAVPH